MARISTGLHSSVVGRWVGARHVFTCAGNLVTDGQIAAVALDTMPSCTRPTRTSSVLLACDG